MSTYVNYIGDGVQTSFPVPFPFILREHVQVEVDGKATAFSWITDALISITPAPASGTVVRVFRVTPVDEPLVAWEDGANLTAANMTTDTKQAIYAAEENRDNTDTLAARLDAADAKLSSRVLRTSETESFARDIPDKEERAGNLLAFDAEGEPVAAVPEGLGVGAIVTPFTKTLLDDSDAATARATLGAISPADVKDAPIARPASGGLALPLKHFIKRLWVRPEDFGPVPDGTSDNLAAIQAAFDTGENVEFGPYDYRISGAIQVLTKGQHVRGQGALTRILSTSPTADHFLLGDGTNFIEGLEFQDMVLWSTVTKTDGHCFNGRMVDSCHWKNVQCGSLGLYGENASAHRLWHGWYFDGFFRCSLDDRCVAVTGSHGVMARGRNGGTYGAELDVAAKLIFCGTSDLAAGVLIGGGCGGVYLNGEISRCFQGVRISTELEGTWNRELFFLPRAIIDSCADYGVVVLGNSAALIDITGSWFTSSGRYDSIYNGVGFYSTEDCTAQIRWTGGRLYNNRVAGAVIAGGKLTMTGVDVSAQGDVNSLGYGVWIPAPTADGAVITGNRFFANKKGVVIVPDGISFTVSNNVFSDNPVAIENAPGVSASRIVRDNVGYVTENSGVAFINAGQTSVTVAHGLSVTPRQVLVTPVSPVQNGLHFIESVDQTNFVLNNGASASLQRVFYWRAFA